METDCNLSEAVARDPERMMRFEREAKALASLNHPKIAFIFGLEESNGADALVMEPVEGPTVAEQFRQGPLPLNETLTVATQVADGLECVKERGIFDRDLKPSNLTLMSEGRAKLLDFGLAKALQGEMSKDDSQHSPTLTEVPTSAGMLLGTAAYMAPEQTRDKHADRRAEIWAGCVLYKMLTRRLAFGDETRTDTLATVVSIEPDWTHLPQKTPVAFANYYNAA